MFTDRFIRISITLYNKEISDSIGYNSKTREGEAKFRFNPFEISHYRETENSDNENLDHTLVYFKNGDSFVFDISLSEFEKLLNNFDNK